MNQDTKTLLRISRNHVSLSKKSKEQKRIDHSIVSIVFSAISVEAAINLAICSPALHIKNRGQRIFLGTLLTNYFSATIPKKLGFLFKVYPTLKQEKELGKEIKNLFSFRNKIVHSTPIYSEAIDLSEVFERIDEKSLTVYDDNERFLQTTPTLHLKDVNSLFKDIPSLAEKYYEIAERFLKLLDNVSLKEVENGYLDSMRNSCGT